MLMIKYGLISQDVYQQTYLELNDKMTSDDSFQCLATTSIKLLPGFSYVPEKGNDMSLEIDRYSVFPPVEGEYGGIDATDNGVVGTLSGTFDMSNTGAAVYSVKIETPDAIGGLKPNLSLVYNNQMSNGIMGWSWELSGLSSIVRTGQTEYHDNDVTDVDFVNDRYLMDGQRLMLVKGSCYGGNNSEYKAEIDRMDRIVSYSNNDKSPEYFVVWRSDGTIWEYGVTSDSRVETKDDNKIILKWMLNKISDRNGNAVVFSYDKNIDHGEAYINNIQYTSNEDAGIDAAYKVSFVYDKKLNDEFFGYVNGNMIINDRLLKHILIYNNRTGKKLFDYSLEYYNPGTYDENDFIYHRLKSIGLTAGEDKINPTRILWNDKKKHYDNKYKIYQLDRSTFCDNVPFVGDFNGDGYSDVFLIPYKIQNTYPSDIEGNVYLNNCEGGFYTTPAKSINLSRNIEWVYVADINGDDVDDIVLYELNNEFKNSDDNLVTLHFYVTKKSEFVKIATYSYNHNVALLPGKFMVKDNSGFLVVVSGDGNDDYGSVEYIRMNNNILERYGVSGMGLFTNETDYAVFDITGDGLSELMVLFDNGYKILKLNNDGNYGFEVCSQGTSVVKDDFLFPNDYNGDGKTDLLYYKTSRQWKIAFSKGNAFDNPLSCTDTYLLRHVVLSTKDKYKYSLREMQSPSVAIRTGDFDGDGVADVAVFNNKAGNIYLEIGFKTYIKSDNKCDFANNERYYMPINYTHQTIYIGRFLPQENVSILSSLPRNPLNTQKANIVSLYPQSAYYSVERVVDGLGNARGFSYDYLMQNNREKFYICSNDIVNKDVKRISIPVLALRSDTLFSINESPIVTNYEYYNALIHSKGHGFMGFERILTRTYVRGELLRKKIQGYDNNIFKDNAIVVPSYMREFNGENQLVKDQLMLFTKYSCKTNNKVIMPLQTYGYESILNPDKPGEVLKFNVIENNYESDVSSNDLYDDVVRQTSVVRGFSNKINMEDVDNCLYKEKEVYTYKDDIVNWIVNRPIEIFKYRQDDDSEMFGGIKKYVYDDKVPNQIVEEINIPNCKNDITDSLTTIIVYEYDKVGNIVQKSISSASARYKKVVKSEYDESYGCMYKTKSIDELGRETRCIYDNDYGYLFSTTDHNGFVTLNEKDPLGINDVVVLPDGMIKTRVLRWAKNNQHAPLGSTYYTWEKSTGMAETMVFYHKIGVELRRVSFDINGKAIYVDKKYDDCGNLICESLPYYVEDDKYCISYVFDRFNRLVEKRLPNSVVYEIHYDGNDVTTECISTDGKRRITKDKYNFMGWMIGVEDAGGNEIIYDYYSDGLVKSAAIANNPKMKLTVTYDNLRNKKTLYDPNYGLVSYRYDAFGNLLKVVDPNGGTIEFVYDALGRKMSRSENTPVNAKNKFTRWIYDEEKGKDGMLKSVVSDNHQVDYVYDSQLRLVSTIEIIKGNEYKTTYNYDPANRVSCVIYPSGLCLSKVYSNSGYEKEIYDGDVLLWKTKKTQADGSVTEYQFGNGTMTKMLYNPQTSLIQSIVAYNEKECIQNLNYDYDDLGNMLRRIRFTDTKMYEDFEYDEFDRLVSVKLNGKNYSNMDYDYLGNIIGKEEGGVNVLYSTVYDTTKPNAILKAKTDEKKMVVGFNRDMKFSTFDNMISVSQGDDLLEIEYGNDNQRVYMHSLVNGKIKSKTYAGDCELVEVDGHSVMLTYVDGPIGIFAVCVIDDKGNKTINYVHKDNLGSWNVITDENSNVIQDVAYDAWGNVRNGKDWSEVYGQYLMYDRGFTGHEHIADFGLINMNGRMYDPMMSMMLSPDNNIQLPQMSQNYNRYSYCLNNPLKYADPTGEFVESLVMGFGGGLVNVAMNATNIDGFGEFALAFGAGFVKGFLTEYTLGQSWFLQVGVRTLTASITSGFNKMIAIGDGSFKFSGNDWNSIKTSAHYALGRALVNNIMFTYTTQPTADQYALSLFESCCNQEIMYSVTSVVAHRVGCWFSGQPFLQTMKFKDVGFDLKMLGIIARRMFVSYVSDSEFADQAIRQRAQEIKESMLEELRAEDPDHPYFYYTYEVKGACVDKMRLYIVGDIFQMLPVEMFELCPRPCLHEIVSFPFSFSLFKSLFFNGDE